MKRKKILLLCEDIRTHSGIANVGKNIILSTVEKYDWVNLGAIQNHPENGKKIDVSESINKELKIDNSSVVIYANNGFGNPDIIRQLLNLEKPDAIFLITDPRQWVWLFQIENEIRKHCPIVYLNVWDNYPIPYYNKSYYESCDALLGISKQTVFINKKVLAEKAETKIIEYIPHGINTTVFYKMSEEDKIDLEFLKFKKEIFKNKDYNFCVLFNSRNLSRKKVSDTILSYKLFIEKLTKAEAQSCVLILHTQDKDIAGTNLTAVIEFLHIENMNIIVTDKIFSETQVNYLYNLGDLQILISSNEGWGLSLTEAILTGTPILANVTGGIQDQMGFLDDNGNPFEPSDEILSNSNKTFENCGPWAFPIFPKVSTMEGSIETPYIFSDICSQEDVAVRLLEAYFLGKEELEKRGLIGLNWAKQESVGFTSEIMGKKISKVLDQLFSTWKPRENYEFILIEN